MGLLRRTSKSNRRIRARSFDDAPAATPRSRRRRLLVETLGQRRVLAVITGEIFHDVDHSLRSEPGEVRLPSRLAYIDANENASLDAGERLVVAGPDGRFRFEDVDDGIYSVRLFEGSSSQVQTFPSEATQSTLPVAVDVPVDSYVQGDTLTLLTSTSLVRQDFSGQEIERHALGFDATGIISASVETAGGFGTLVAGTMTTRTGVQEGAWLVLPDSAPHLVGVGLSAGTFALAADGAGVALQPDAEGQRLVSIGLSDATGSQPSIQFSPTETHVPDQAQLIVSEASQFGAGASGSRTVIAWPDGDDRLQLALWSNSSESFIFSQPKTVDHATELVSFDDQAGLLAVRYDHGGIGVFDVDAGFAPLHEFEELNGPARLIPGKDALAGISSDESGHQLSIHDMRAGSALLSHFIDLDEIGLPLGISAGDALDSVVILGKTGLASVALDRAGSHRVRVEDGRDPRQVKFGVRLTQANSTPSAEQDSLQVQALEDAQLALSPGELAGLVDDGDDDELISYIVNDPANGMVEVQPGGGVVYRPNEDFFGNDTFAIGFHDGQAPSPPITVAVAIAGVPDPPSGITLSSDTVPENHVSYTIGNVQVSDVDLTGQYELWVDDQRFEIVAGQLVLNGGPLNYEEEIEIDLTISAMDFAAGQTFEQSVLVRVTDQNDAIEAVMPEEADVEENTPGARIVQLEAIDEDIPVQTVTFTVDDGRFEVIDDVLFLKQGFSLDYEAEPLVTVTVTADDGAGSTLSTKLHIQVHDQPEDVGQISLSNETVLEWEPGATVGDVLIDGVAAPDSYEVSVDDPRFEIDGSELKLIDEQWVRRSDAEQIELTISAQDTSGVYEGLSEKFVIYVLENDSPFHNDDDPYDVDGNGVVSPLDALAIINYLNIYGPGPVGPGDPGYGYDVNGDGEVTALDALLVINHLNKIANGGGAVGGGGEGDNDGQTNQGPEGEGPEGDGEGARQSGIIAPVNDAPLAQSPLQKSAPTNAGSDWLREVRDEEDDDELARAVDDLLTVLDNA